jgi:lipid-A-disaccharide synthase
VLILVDFPGFNLRIAKWAHLNKIKTAYYISPQIWAWKTSRVNIIKKIIDKMIVILPFEKDFYRKFDCDVDYVGHPLLDNIINNENIDNEAEKKLITLIPGSRKQEIKKMLPIMSKIIKYFPQFEFVIAGVPNFNEIFYQKMSNDKIKVEYNKLPELLSKSKAALVTSGTATLETALYNVPMVVCYKSTKLSYHIAKKLIKVNYISLVNLIMNQEIVKELIQNDLNENNLKKELNKICFDENKRNITFENYFKLKQILNKKGASENAAKIIYELIKTN